MSLLQHLSKQTLHHTNICVGNRNEIIQDIDACISKITQDTTRIERLVYEYDKFLVIDAEHIFATHLHKTGPDEMQIICMLFNSTNIETQNKILKMLEEPRPHTYFFIVIPNLNTILPTIISRAQVFVYKREIEIEQETQKFITSTLKDRLEYLKKIIEDVKDEKTVKQDILEFVEQLEKHIHQKHDIHTLKRIIQVKEYIRDQGASMKQLLEYIAITI